MQMNFTSEIRSVVDELQQKLESTYLAFRLTHGLISKLEYIWILAQMYYLHKHQEQLWQNDRALSQLYDLKRYSRLEKIRDDLNTITIDHIPAIDSATRNLQQQISKMYKENSFSLIGTLSVLESSRQGFLYLSEPLMNDLSLQDFQDVSSYLYTPEPWYRDWYRFKECISRIDDLPQQLESISYAAVAAFEGMIEIYKTKPV